MAYSIEEKEYAEGFTAGQTWAKSDAKRVELEKLGSEQDEYPWHFEERIKDSNDGGAEYFVRTLGWYEEKSPDDIEKFWENWLRSNTPSCTSVEGFWHGAATVEITSGCPG